MRCASFETSCFYNPVLSRRKWHFWNCIRHPNKQETKVELSLQAKLSSLYLRQIAFTGRRNFSSLVPCHINEILYVIFKSQFLGKKEGKFWNFKVINHGWEGLHAPPMMHEVCNVSVYSQPSQWIRKGLPFEQLEMPFHLFLGKDHQKSYWGIGVGSGKIFMPAKIN